MVHESEHRSTAGTCTTTCTASRERCAGEHPGRSRNPVIKVVDIAWLEFEKPDLTRAEAFARAFGFQTAQRGPDELHLRGTDAGAPCVIVRRGPRTRFAGVAFRAADEVDVLRLADKSGAPRGRCRRPSAACRST